MSEKYCTVCGDPLLSISAIAAGRCQSCFEAPEQPTPSTLSPEIGEGASQAIEIIEDFPGWNLWKSLNGWMMLPNAHWIQDGNPATVKNTESLYAQYEFEKAKFGRPTETPATGERFQPLEGDLLSAMNKTTDRLFQREGATGEVPADVMEWIEAEAEKAYQASGYFKPTGRTMWHQAAKAMGTAMYHKMQEDKNFRYELFKQHFTQYADEITQLKEALKASLEELKRQRNDTIH